MSDSDADDDLLVGPATLRASVRVEDSAWAPHDPAAVVDAVARAVAGSAHAPEGDAEWEALFADDRTLADLNGRYRGKTGPTNVLSFLSGNTPASGEACFLGGIALAYGQTAREAEERGIPFAHHAAHLTLHGLLHLLGHDHERSEDDRVAMERIEIELLEGLGIPDPYQGS